MICWKPSALNFEIKVFISTRFSAKILRRCSALYSTLKFLINRSNTRYQIHFILFLSLRWIWSAIFSFLFAPWMACGPNQLMVICPFSNQASAQKAANSMPNWMKWSLVAKMATHWVSLISTAWSTWTNGRNLSTRNGKTVSDPVFNGKCYPNYDNIQENPVTISNTGV